MKVNWPKLVTFLFILVIFCLISFLFGIYTYELRYIARYNDLYESYIGEKKASERAGILLGQCMNDYENKTGKNYEAHLPNPWDL